MLSCLILTLAGGAAMALAEQQQSAMNTLEVNGAPEKTTATTGTRLRLNLRGDAAGHVIGVVLNARHEPTTDAQVTARLLPASLNRSIAARTDPSGAFVLDYPALAEGTRPAALAITAVKDGQTTESVTPIGDLALTLTPPPTNAADRISLAGEWQFQPDPPEAFWTIDFADQGWGRIAVPSHWVMQGYDAKSGVGGYRRWLDLPAAWQGQRILVRFEGVHTGAEVWLNGQRVGYHDGGATPFEFDLTAAARPGQRNLLAVRVSENTESSRLDAMSWYIHFQLSGIYREATVFAVPPAHIARLQAETELDAEFRNALLHVRVAVANDQDQPLGNGRVVLTLAAPGEPASVVARQELPVELDALSRREFPVDLPVNAPRLWDPEHPVLYTLTAVLEASGRPASPVNRRVGFRQVAIKGEQFLLNGQPIKLRGADRHDSYAALGRAITPEIARQDLELMKDCNMNGFRTSHYPPHPAVLDLADELGFGVEEEAALCFVGASWGPPPTDFPRPAWDPWLLPIYAQQAAEMLERDRSHPSVLWWSLANESDFGDPMNWMKQWVKRSDPTRPVSVGGFAQLEITMAHNPVLVDLVKGAKKYGTPVLGEESMAIFMGFGENGEELEIDPGLRDLWVDPLVPVWDELLRSPWYLGSFTWCWADDLFVVPGAGVECTRYMLPYQKINVDMAAYQTPEHGVAGEFTWGVIDGWRRPRPEWWHHKKLFSPVKIKEGPVLVTAEGTIPVAVENRHDFTNLSEVRFVWAIGATTGTVKCDLPPHAVGVLNVPAPAGRELHGQTLDLKCFAPGGRLLDAWRLPIGPVAREPEHGTDAPAPELREAPRNLAGTLMRVIGKDFELAFDKDSGRLWRGLAGGRPVLLNWPVLHVQPNTDPFAIYPGLKTWAPKKVEFKQADKTVEVTLTGVYKDFDGRYDIRIDGAGRIETHYRFTYSGEEIHAREVGLQATVAPGCDTLDWERQAEWSVYPEDHIGRPAGTAQAVTAVKNSLPPDHPWALDNTPLGSNDFRSAKRNIRRAVLRDAAGRGVECRSDATQTARACLGRYGIEFNLLDYYGGTKSTNQTDIYEQTYGIGRKLVKGDVLEGTVCLRLVRP